MESLFDLDRPYFAAWLELCDIDTPSPWDSTFYVFTPNYKLGASPLYYAALCGFRDLVGNLIVKYPQHVNASGGYYLTPLVASLAGKHFQTAESLRLSGADPNVQCYAENTPLHSAACYGDVEMVQKLLYLEADINVRNERGETPLYYILNPSSSLRRIPLFPILLGNVAQLLLGRGANINARTNSGLTPLHTAVERGWIEVVHVLLEHGADVKDTDGRTPFSLAKESGYDEIMKLLSEYGAE